MFNRVSAFKIQKCNKAIIIFSFGYRIITKGISRICKRKLIQSTSLCNRQDLNQLFLLHLTLYKQNVEVQFSTHRQLGGDQNVSAHSLHVLQFKLHLHHQVKIFPAL